MEIGVKLSPDHFLLTSLTKACRLKNDVAVAVQRLAIRKGMLKILLDQLNTIFNNDNVQQPYLLILFRVVYIAAYYGLLRIGEVTKGPHMIQAKNTHIGINKKKILFILMSSKTHCKGNKPQQIKISVKPCGLKMSKCEKFKYSPFCVLQDYIKVRSPAKTDCEQFFVYSDNSPLCPQQVHANLRKLLQAAGFNKNNYSFHSFKAG